ncbi:phiSA1p31-related protein [Thermomonospora amylolytica]|uniref:phiSA1p31-related protein n=1 Tax=Thermomonospora amylolytica TaxID=1411117 RepID=UPI000E6C4402|nr:phiSA1p31-related protein [Thermomonospora amylolytica]
MTTRAEKILTDELADSDRHLSELTEQADALRIDLASTEQALEKARREHALLAGVRAMMTGEAAPLTPRDIHADDDVLGIRIGPLLLAPAGDGTADRRLYLATLRAIQDVLIHQVRLAVDSLDAELHRQQQADVPTGQWPAVQPPLGAMVDNEDQPTRWTSPNGQVWDLTIHYADHAGDTWHWAGGFQAVVHGDGEVMEPLMSRDDWRQQDVPLSVVVKRDGPLTPVTDRAIVPPAGVRDVLTPPPDPYRPAEVTVPDGPCGCDHHGDHAGCSGEYGCECYLNGGDRG